MFANDLLPWQLPANSWTKYWPNYWQLIAKKIWELVVWRLFVIVWQITANEIVKKRTLTLGLPYVGSLGSYFVRIIF